MRTRWRGRLRCPGLIWPQADLSAFAMMKKMMTCLLLFDKLAFAAGPVRLVCRIVIFVYAPSLIQPSLVPCVRVRCDAYSWSGRYLCHAREGKEAEEKEKGVDRDRPLKSIVPTPPTQPSFQTNRNNELLLNKLHRHLREFIVFLSCQCKSLRLQIQC